MNIRTRILSLLLFGALSQQASALQMEPLSMVLKPSGGGASKTFRVTNSSNKPIAVQFSVTTRQQQGGKEVRKPVGNQLTVYPAQTIIPARTTQKVRVKYQGNPKLAKEQAYRLIAEQVHVSLSKENNTGVNMIMTLVGALYVQPAKTNSNLVVKQVQRQGQNLAVTVSNTGTRHKLMKTATLTLKNNRHKAFTLHSKNLKGLVGKNLLAGATRRFTIPLPAGFSNDQWVATLETQ